MRVSNRFDKRLFFVYNKEDRMSRERASCAKKSGMEKFIPSLQKHTFRHICGVDVKLIFVSYDHAKTFYELVK